jgi:hypothetical protein
MTEAGRTRETDIMAGLMDEAGNLTHARSCSAGYTDNPCTCALNERKALSTEQAMHAAWRKRAEEAEAALTTAHAAGAAETERKIVAWLRENPAIPEWSGSRYAALISDMIERGDYGRTTPPKEPANDEAK